MVRTIHGVLHEGYAVLRVEGRVVRFPYAVQGLCDRGGAKGYAIAGWGERDVPIGYGDRVAFERPRHARYDTGGLRRRQERARYAKPGVADTGQHATNAPDAMAPPNKRITPVGVHLRNLRKAMNVDQKTFGALVFFSDRTVSRWENGVHPPKASALKILELAAQHAPDLHDAMAPSLGFELESDASVVTSAPVLVVPQPQRASAAEMRAALDAVVYSAAEERDLLPRHLRAFGVELLQAVERLGLSAREGAELVAVREKKGKSK